MTRPHFIKHPKTAARLYAVQAVYSVIASKEKEEDALLRIKELVRESVQFCGDEEDPMPKGAKPDEAYLEKILSGALKEYKALDALYIPHLKEGWKVERMGALMQALLRCAVYELTAFTDVPPRVIIDEYVGIAFAFLNDKEVGFMNAILDTLARKYRTDQI